MDINELKQQINRVIGVKGDLRIQAWWMNKLLNDMLVYCSETDNTKDISDVKTFFLNELKNLETALVDIIEKSENDLTESINTTESDLNERIDLLESKELFKIVDSLPEVGENNIIYLILNDNYESRNILSEYIYINESWEKFGDVTIKTPDWNALEGEDGYIKNKTHYYDISLVTDYSLAGRGIYALNINNAHNKLYFSCLENNVLTDIEIEISSISDKTYTAPNGVYTFTLQNNNNTVLLSSAFAPALILNDIKLKSSGVKQLADEFIPSNIVRIDNIPASIGIGTGSLVQTKEVETFENQAPIAENPNEEIVVDAVGDNSVVLNGKSHAGAKRALAHGNRTIALGENSHTEGHCTQVINLDDINNGYAAHAEGYGTIAAGTYSHAEGNTNIVTASNAHGEGKDTINQGDSSHTEGYGTYTGSNNGGYPDRPVIDDSISGGDQGTGDSGVSISPHEGVAAHAEGNYTRAYGNYSHTEGRQCDTWGEGSHAEGTGTIASGDYSHTEGNKTQTRTNGLYSHAEGISTEVAAAGAHAEGLETVANAENSHTEGWACSTQVAAKASHAEGQNCHTYDVGSHAEGQNTKAYGAYSHVEGYETQSKAGTRGQHVEGKYNYVTDGILVIGCGTDDDHRYNAVEVGQDGRVFVKNVGGFNGQSSQTDTTTDLATIIESLTPYYTSFSISDIESWVGLSAQPVQEQGLQNAILNKRSIRIPIDTVENKGYVTCISCEVNDLIYLKVFCTNNLYSIDVNLTGSEVTVNSNSLF